MTLVVPANDENLQCRLQMSSEALLTPNTELYRRAAGIHSYSHRLYFWRLLTNHGPWKAGREVEEAEFLRRLGGIGHLLA